MLREVSATEEQPGTQFCVSFIHLWHSEVLEHVMVGQRMLVVVAVSLAVAVSVSVSGLPAPEEVWLVVSVFGAPLPSGLLGTHVPVVVSIGVEASWPVARALAVMVEICPSGLVWSVVVSPTVVAI